MVNLPIEYSSKKVTPWGGMRLMKEFLDRTEIRSFLNTLDLPVSGSNRGYAAPKIIESFWLSIWTGASRYIHADWLRYDKTLQKIFNFTSMPSQSTYSRFFHKFSWQRNNTVFPALQKWFVDNLSFDNVTIDLDSTIITRYGEQEGSNVGYNPAKRGRKSHHPLMAFISQTRMVANAWMRPGNSSDAGNYEGFLSETFDDILKDKQIGLIRADSGFYSNKFLTWFEERHLNYIIAVKLYMPVKWEIQSIKNWVDITSGIEVARFFHQPQNGKKRRYVVVRKHIQRRPKAGGKLLLFEEEPVWRYSCFVTNLDLPADQIWNMYKTRADAENRIKELKQDFGIENFCLKKFWATEASFRFIMVAYNLMSLFRHFALNHHKRATLSTLQSHCFALGAWTVNHANQKVLKISLPVKKRPWLDGLFDQIHKTGPPYKYSNA